MQKLNFWAPIQEPKWHTKSVHRFTYPPPSPELSVYEKLTQHMEFSRVQVLVSFRGENVADENYRYLLGFAMKLPTGTPTTFKLGQKHRHFNC